MVFLFYINDIVIFLVEDLLSSIIELIVTILDTNSINLAFQDFFLFPMDLISLDWLLLELMVAFGFSFGCSF